MPVVWRRGARSAAPTPGSVYATLLDVHFPARHLMHLSATCCSCLISLHVEYDLSTALHCFSARQAWQLPVDASPLLSATTRHPPDLGASGAISGGWLLPLCIRIASCAVLMLRPHRGARLRRGRLCSVPANTVRVIGRARSRGGVAHARLAASLPRVWSFVCGGHRRRRVARGVWMTTYPGGLLTTIARNREAQSIELDGCVARPPYRRSALSDNPGHAGRLNSPPPRLDATRSETRPRRTPRVHAERGVHATLPAPIMGRPTVVA